MRTLRVIGLTGAALLAACAADGPKPPEWQFEAKGSLDRATSAYMEGNTRVEAAEMARARSQLSRSGRADLLANAELASCATRVASLVFEPCAGFEKLRDDATPAQRAYADYLMGQLAPQRAALLPEPQRATAAGSTALPATDDPLSKLVAAGVLLQTGKASPTVIAQAVEIASERGWRRPLLGWLGVQRKLAEQRGDAEAVARLTRRIALTEAAPAPVKPPASTP